ncbi:FK506-binding protein 15 isoform X2 [Pristis pectinata]|uniref:FK506-binding protein 15 isoform X2 n=1 Tax=Pristis pectinata TaxID=685728 RepID=UPI00223D995E|nr:FK506-binding protein 15 isoform X2 [Pristis pectinata]
MSLFGADDDDADFLSPSSGSKLASLFGMDQAATGQGNESFQYTAPKQPKKGAQAPGVSSQKPPPTGVPPAVVFASAVHAYQYLNGQYVKQGKLGAAILGNHASGEYKILLYASQQKKIAAARITSTFTFTVQANNYCMFYDDQRQNWSIMFESEKAVVEFSKQVCIAKCNCTSSLESVLIQDLIPGDGQAVETGDSLEVSYTGWLYQNNTFGQVFDTNVNKDKLLRLKLGSGKVIKGWEIGMLGMKKSAKRLLIIPPNQAYGSQGMPNRVPPDSTLIFEVEVKRVKFAKESGFDRQSIGSRDSVASSPAPSVESLPMETSIPAPMSIPPKPGEHNVRAKSNSLSDMLSNPDTTKAKLISRMAKMGQPMPFLAGALSAQPDSSDSELEDHSSKGAPLAVAPSIQHTAAPVHSLPPQHPPPVPVSMLPTSSAALMPVALPAQQGLSGSGQSFQPYTGMSYGYTQGHGAQTQIQTIGPMYPAQAPQYQAGGDVTSFMMTEARQHNTEIRLAISKASDKIDQLALKMEDLQKHVTGPSIPGISSLTMETSMIMHNIQRIIQENERLKQEVFDKSSRIEEQNGKISDLIQRNQRYVEQSNLLMEQRNDSLISSTENNQARILLAEQEKVKVTEELAVATSQVAKLQLELTAHQKKEMELRSQLASAQQKAEGQGLRLNSVEVQLTELQEASERAQTKCKAEKQSRKQLEVKVASMEEELVDLRAEKDNLEKSLAERKRKAITERQRAEQEMDEIRKSYEEELENVRSLLRKTRSSTDQAAAEQISVMQAELESQWQAKCDRMLASAKEQHNQQYREVCEQRESQQLKISQLEAKLATLKESRVTEEAKLLSLQEQADELQALKERYSSLEQRAVAMKEHYEGRIQELQQQAPVASEALRPDNTAEEVKKIMNGVFQSVRREFDLDEMYSGRSVLGIIMNTIKAVTLQFLCQDQPHTRSDDEDEESEGETEEKAASPVNSQNVKVDTNTAEGVSGAVHEEGPTAPEVDQLSEVTSSSYPPGAIEHEENQAEAQDSKAPELDQPETPLTHARNIPALSLNPPAGDDLGNNPGHMEEWTGEKDEKEVLAPPPDPADLPGSERSLQDAEVQEDEGTPEKKRDHVSKVQHSELDRDSLPNRSTAGERQEDQPQAHSNSISEVQEVAEPSETLQALNGNKGSPEIPEGSALQSSQASSEHDMLHVAEHGSNTVKPVPEPKSVSSTNSSSLFNDDDDNEGLFKSATPKLGKTVKHLVGKEDEEEDEEEVSMKGRPPPAPLFGDDDDDDDFDWLG